MTEKILKIVTIVMFAITVVILGFFIFGGEVPDQVYTTPVYAASLLNWAYILFFDYFWRVYGALRFQHTIFLYLILFDWVFLKESAVLQAYFLE